jgi:hypothetical protein
MELYSLVSQLPALLPLTCRTLGAILRQQHTPGQLEGSTVSILGATAAVEPTDLLIELPVASQLPQQPLVCLSLCRGG